MFPSLDSPLPDLERAQELLNSVAFWGLLVIGFTVGVFGPIISRYRTKLDEKITEKRAGVASAEATTRANNLQAELERANQSIASLLRINNEISQKVTSRADMLTAEARTALVEKLKGLPPKGIGIITAEPTSESTEFATALADLLQKAGCLSGTGTTIGSNFGVNVTGRVLVQPTGQGNELIAEQIAAALKDVGIPDVGIQPAQPGLRSGSHAQIIVRPK
jgi:hypothetical protein